MADVVKTLNSGLAIITNLLSGAGTSPKYIGWGTGTTAADAANTGLETPAAEARTSGTESRQTTNTTNDTYRVVGTITCTGTAKAITEVALYDNDTAGNAFMRATFDAINVNPGDSVQFTINNVIDQGA